MSSTRNLGIDIAKSNWLYFVNSDDTIYPEALSLMMKMDLIEQDLIVHGLENYFVESNKYQRNRYNTYSFDDYSTIIEHTDLFGLLKGPV